MCFSISTRANNRNHIAERYTCLSRIQLSHFNIFKRPVAFYGDSKNFSHSTYLANIFYSCYVTTDYKVYYYY